MKHRFEIGKTFITPTALHILHPEDVRAALTRHAAGDWGEVCDSDRAENEFSVDERLRLLSAYRDRSGRKFWIITEADRSATTILLPEEY